MTVSGTWHRKALTLILIVISLMLFYYGCRTSEELTKPKEETPTGEQVGNDFAETETKYSFTPADQVPGPMTEFRGVWVATVANIDWPSEPGLSVDQQKKELITLLDRAASLHFNAVIFQVRPAADAIYNSPYEPWSYYLTGKMGRAPLPEFDPLEFIIREAHHRGLELHAWFNPYRAGHPTDPSEISPDHISQTQPDYVVEYGEFLWLDPGSEGAREHTLNVIMDVVERYNIDGVHFDDYFYPYPSYAGGADFPDEKSWKVAQQNGNTLPRGDWRRENVNKLMKELSERIKETKPHVKFGISPFGIWRPGFPENTTGFDAYENLYADARLWLKEGWVDYFTPQIYYRIDQIPQPFPVMLEWWVEQNDYNRHMWPGLYTSRIRTTGTTWPSDEITGQVYTARGFPGVSGTVHFSMKVFLENTGKFNQKVASGVHSLPAIIPASPWLNGQVPAPPSVQLNDYGSYYALHIEHNHLQEIRWWIVRKKRGNQWDVDVLPASRTDIRYYGGKTMTRPEEIWVSAVNRFGLESEMSADYLLKSRNSLADTTDLKKPQIINRMDWGKNRPGGVEANAMRRNILAGDTLRFQDISIIFDGIIKSMPFPGELLNASGTEPETNEKEKETIILRLFKNGATETVRVEPGEAFNWYGYHIGILGADFNSKMIQLETGTVSSLSVDRSAFRSVGNANNRLKVPHRIDRITLHHTCSPGPLSSEKDPAEVLRNLYQWGVEDRNWWDVPYHYLVDLDGTIYEGRDPGFAGETNTTYDPRGHLLISVMGNYNQQAPTEKQVQSIIKLMAYSIKKYGLNSNQIGAHSDHTDTSCPGSKLQILLDNGSIIKSVEELLQNTQRQ